MSHLMTADQFQKQMNISRATFYNWKKAGMLNEIKIHNDLYYYRPSEIKTFTEEETKLFLESRFELWNAQLKSAHTIYKHYNKPTKDTTELINKIESEAKYYSNLFKTTIKGYNKRSLQIKVKTGSIERKTRREKSPFRNHVLKSRPETFQKAIDLVSSYFQDSLGSLNLAIDRAINYAKNNEDYYEVAAVNIHTLRRHIAKAAKQSGYRTVHEYLNHFNTFRKSLAYVKGSFTDDIEFGQVFSMDDHKFDIAGVQVWNEEKSEFEKKQLYSWFVVEMKTMYPLAWSIKASPFTSEDIIKLMMRCFRQHGLPTVKFICDQGLGKSERIKEFCNRLNLILEPQEPYCPTQKAVNERLFGIIKEECDVYNENFTGSNHPVEGRHRDRTLSPEETTELVNEAIERYENYLTGFFLDRPRKREIKGIEHLYDNSGRVSTRILYEHYIKSFEPKKVTDIQLRYAYMNYEVVKNFDNFYLKFKKEIYLPDSSSELSIVLNDKSYTYTVAYNPDDLNKIDLYSNQDIIDRITGDFISKGDYVCTLESLANLPAEEKKRRVAVYNKHINKKIKELAVNLRAKGAVEKNLINTTVGDTGMNSIIKEQTKEIENVIKNHLPMEQITDIVSNEPKTSIDTEDDEVLDNTIASLNNINLNE